MKKSRFTEMQIVSISKETDAGMKVEELRRPVCTVRNWKTLTYNCVINGEVGSVVAFQNAQRLFTNL